MVDKHIVPWSHNIPLKKHKKKKKKLEVMKPLCTFLSPQNNLSWLPVCFPVHKPLEKVDLLLIKPVPFRVDSYWHGKQKHFWQNCHPCKCIHSSLHLVAILETVWGNLSDIMGESKGHRGPPYFTPAASSTCPCPTICQNQKGMQCWMTYGIFAPVYLVLCPR